MQKISFLITLCLFFCVSSYKGLSVENFEQINANRRVTHNRLDNYNDKFNGQEELIGWLDDNIFGGTQQSNKCFSRSMFAIEAFSGISRGAVFFKLGYDFGRRVSTSIEEPGTTIIAAIYGTGVFVPMAVLGTNLTSNIFKKIFAKKSNSEKLIESHESKLYCFGKYILKIPVVGAGLISAPPMTYLTYDKLHEYLSWGWIVPAIPTFYVRTLMDYYSITTIAQILYNEIKTPLDRRYAISNPNSQRGLISRIKDRLICARSFIASLNHLQTQTLIDELSNNRNSYQKLHILSSPQAFINESVLIKKDNLVKKITGYMGGLIGGYGMWIYYPIAKNSFIPILSLLGIQQNESVLTGLAIASTLTASSLTALATWSSTHKFYDALSGLYSSVCNDLSSCCKPRGEKARLLEEDLNLNVSQTINFDNKLKWKRLGIALLSIVLAGCNSGMQGEIAFEFLDMSQTSSKFNLAAAVIASFSTCFWAVDETLLNYLNASDPRNPLLVQIDKIIEKLSNMSDESLKNLMSSFKENNDVEIN